MAKKLIHYSENLTDCHCYRRIFHAEFETYSTDSETEFMENLRKEDSDAAVVCICSAEKFHVETITKFESITSRIPVLTCTRELKPGFISAAARYGVSRFLTCELEKNEIHEMIEEAIHHGWAFEFIKTCHPGCIEKSLHISKMVNEIVYSFPHRLHLSTLAERLRISRSWLQRQCQKAFGMTFSRLQRRIWIHQALRMMKYTSLDNTEIVLHLNYSETSNMARDFRKELSLSPTEARRLLLTSSPEEILQRTV